VQKSDERTGNPVFAGEIQKGRSGLDSFGRWYVEFYEHFQYYEGQTSSRLTYRQLFTPVLNTLLDLGMFCGTYGGPGGVQSSIPTF
jgi:hypothetical protein